MLWCYFYCQSGTLVCFNICLIWYNKLSWNASYPTLSKHVTVLSLVLVHTAVTQFSLLLISEEVVFIFWTKKNGSMQMYSVALVVFWPPPADWKARIDKDSYPDFTEGRNLFNWIDGKMCIFNNSENKYITKAQFTITANILIWTLRCSVNISPQDGSTSLS